MQKARDQPGLFVSTITPAFAGMMAQRDYSIFLRCWFIMKVSKVFSETCCQR
jgi:hypothetical protein